MCREQKYSLVGVNGNAYSIMGYTMAAMRQEGFSKAEVSMMLDEAKSADYNHLISVCLDYIEAANEKANERLWEEDR